MVPEREDLLSRIAKNVQDLTIEDETVFFQAEGKHECRDGCLRDSKESSLIGEQDCHRNVVKVEAGSGD